MSDWEDDIYDDENEEEFSFEEDDSDNEIEDDTQAELTTGNEVNNNDTNGQGTELLDIESLYFKGKVFKEDENYTDALNSFNRLVNLRQDPRYSGNSYIFKAVKQVIKVYEELGDNDSVLSYLSVFFELIPTVEKTYAASSMTKLLYRYDRSSNITPTVLQNVYQLFIKYLSGKDALNTKEHKVLLRASLYSANTFILQQNFDKAAALLSKLEKAVSTSTNSLKDAFLLDIIASEMALIIRHRFDLDELVRLSNTVASTKAAIPQSRIIGTIKESAGIIHMYDTEYDDANACFQDSFKAFNECGDNHRTAVLLKFIISNILSESEINPFKSNDFQGFLSEERICILMELYKAVHDVNIDMYISIVNHDPFKLIVSQSVFLTRFIPEITALIKVKYILKYFKVFSTISISKLCSKLHDSECELQSLLLQLNNRGFLRGIKVDWVNKSITKDVNSESGILDKSFNKFALLRNILNSRETKFDTQKLFTEIDEYKNKVQGYDGSFTPNTSPFELCSVKDGEDFDLNMNHTTSDICCDAMITNISSTAKGTNGNEGNTNSSSAKVSISDSSSIADKKEKLFALYNNLCVPKSLLQAEPILSKLFVTSLRCEQTKTFQSKEELLTILDSYLKYIRSAIPTSRKPKIDHIEGIKLKKKEKEYQILHQDYVGERLMKKATSTVDTNIPEILQSSIMQQMSVSRPKNHEQEFSKIDLAHLSEKCKKTLKLKMFLDIYKNIDAYRIDSLITSKRGLRVALFEGIPTSSNSEPISSDSRTNSFAYSQVDHVSKMDTESLESESVVDLSDKDDDNRE